MPLAHAKEKSMIKFLGYKVSDMSFRLNGEAQGEKNFQINPKIRFDIKKDPQSLLMTITVVVDKNQPTPVPFELNLVLTGSFEIKDENNLESLRIRTSSVLFPYVRLTVSSLTSIAGIPPYYLPMIDFESHAEHKNESVIIRPLENLD